MSSINHKKPGFSPLNTRKPNQTVGQTYGERREKTRTLETEGPISWLERAKDKFLGAKKKSNIKEFAHKGDQFLGAKQTSYSANPFVERKNRLEDGLSLQSRVTRPAGDQYVQFLDSVIHYINAAKKKV